MTEVRPPTTDPTPDRPGSAGIAPLLAGYWSFGQFWGVWVILVFEFQREHGITNAGWVCATRCCPRSRSW